MPEILAVDEKNDVRIQYIRVVTASSVFNKSGAARKGLNEH
jgi:hypothetical protein